MKVLVSVRKNISNEDVTYYACCTIPKFSPADTFYSVLGMGSSTNSTIVGSGSSKQEAIENMKKRIRELDCEIFELDI